MSGPEHPRWLWPAFAITSVAFLAAMAIDNETLRLVLKSLPVLVLAAGVFLTVPRTRFRVVMTIGLLLCATGDFLLELGPFVPGLLAFLVGHLFYVAAFVRESKELRPLTGLVFLVIGVVLTLSVVEGADDLAAPVAVYALVICAMGWRAAALHGILPSTVAIPIAVGAAFFILSDALIAINRFRTDIPGDNWWVMLSYFAAQGLIVLGTIRQQDSDVQAAV